MECFKIYEVGCKVNQYESQLMREQLLAAGLREANGSPADVYVINTCTVTASADSDSRGLIRRAMKLNPQAKIVVTGCYVERDADEIRGICPDAVIVRNGEKENIIGAVVETPHWGVSTPRNSGFTGIFGFRGRNRAFVKIQDGCSNRCSYCRVPLVRGRAKSRPREEILLEARNLTASGFKEIVLCGICLGAYKDLCGLLDEMVKIDALKRIRLSSIEPAHVDRGLIDRIASSEKLCRHLHIPLQSGDNRILKAMNRRYTAGQYIKTTDKIRRKIPQVAIATDVLVGFPGETEREFKNTLRVIRAVRPMRVHAFTFSKREGTPAFYMPDALERKDKTERLKAVMRLVQETSFSYRKKFLGRRAGLLIEDVRDRKTNLLTGYTDTYIKVLTQGTDALMNELVQVKITSVMTDATLGQAVAHGN